MGGRFAAPMARNKEGFVQVPKIFQLDSHVADLIAAGEVVERPASVVKELIENSIDAEARIITVEISAGGMTFMRITDDGCGIAPEDVKTAFLRHATSKLKNAQGLESIGTLGFRGEALAAIAAVSRIEVLSRETGAKEGVRLCLEAGEIVDFSPAGCPEGTTIIVRDLFFNTPARLKFMKSDRAEGSSVASAVLRSALAHPDVSVRFIKDGKTLYHTPGDSRVDSCLYSLFGREFSAGLLSADSSDESVSVSGFVSSPNAARGNRSYQFFFVNGRPIRSITLQMALEKAFDNLLPSGRFPACALYISTRLGDVDVNVHPAKTEVKFASDKQVFDGVYYAVLSALERSRQDIGATSESRSSNLPKALISDEGANTETVKGDFSSKSGAGSRNAHAVVRGASGGGFKSMTAEDYRKAFVSEGTKPYSGYGAGKDIGPTHQVEQLTMREGVLSAPPKELSSYEDEAGTVPDYKGTPSSDFDDDSGAQQSLDSTAPIRVLGETFRSYIIVQYNQSVWFIDKHAAHERLHFNALKSSAFEPMSQALITPVVCRHGPDNVSVLLDNSDLLDRLGFSVESFGEDAVAIRQIPSEIDIGETESVLSEICGVLKLGGSPDVAGLDEIFRMIACKSAIKAGRLSGMQELEVLAGKVFSGEASHCPHGRPVFFEVSKSELDKRFKRI